MSNTNNEVVKLIRSSERIRFIDVSSESDKCTVERQSLPV